MSAFDRLDPLVQHHIVNTLGWRDLRPLQEASIEPVLDGRHCLVLAPTAGGKTEAAMFPLLSRVCGERWPAPSIVYVCPLKALINNLGERLERYCAMLGRKAAVWHGDVTASAKQQARKEAPDVILTTPESLEAMLISVNPVMREHLHKVRVVVVDEIHAFAGDDRGWHLLCVLERLVGLARRDFQRVGLSATVGNPEQLLEWLAGNSQAERVVVAGEPGPAPPPEVVLDYVGSLENAATMVSRLHRGEKRLVFCDSRSRVEALAGMLRARSVSTFVSHSSLSAEERRRSEEAFARGADCVIVATSTLELGIDVGDLDRVIQIDSPNRVASFLQRLGRTGRRAGRPRNFLFLCTDEDSLLEAAGLLALWQKGYVEPIVPPPLPYHIMAQQALALCLQNGGMGHRDLLEALERLPAARGMARETIAAILDHLVGTGILASDGTRLFVGETGEEKFGRRHFLELVSVFTSPPVLSVTDGRQELGVVDQDFFLMGGAAEGRVLSLAGRGWRVAYLDWRERRVYVTASEVAGKTTWLGASPGLSLVLCRAIRHVLSDEGISQPWSKRARDRIRQAREEYSFARVGETAVVRHHDGSHIWYTWAGEAVNSALSEALKRRGIATETVQAYGLNFGARLSREAFEEAMQGLNAQDVVQSISADEKAERALKFAECVPAELRSGLIQARQCQESAIQAVLDEARRWICL